MEWLKKLIATLQKILHAMSTSEPTPAPTPAPAPAPVPTSTPINTPAHEVLADMLLIPEEARAAGFSGRENAIYYALSRQVGGMPWGYEGDSDLTGLHAKAQELDAWWAARVTTLVERMRANEGLTVTLIEHDGPDRCGRQLGRGSMNQIPEELRDRVSMGEVVPD